MNVASLELCRELYELSGWDDTQCSWKQLLNHQATQWNDWYVADYNNHENTFMEKSLVAYDVGYVMRKLPPAFEYGGHNCNIFVELIADGNVKAIIAGANLDPVRWIAFGTPEDAVTKLAIELFRQGVLKQVDA